MGKMRFLAAALILGLALSARAQEERPFPKLTVSVKVEEAKHPQTGQLMRILDFSGETGYPEGGVIIVDIRLKEDPAYIEPKFVGRVRDGKWTTRSIEFMDDIYKGLYVVRAGFDPGHQPGGYTSKINPLFNPDIQYVTTEVQIGTAEEIAAERKSSEQFYVRSYKSLKALVEKTLEQFEKQKKELDPKEWHAFAQNIMPEFLNEDQKLGEWRKLKKNVAMIDMHTEISTVLANLMSFTFEELSKGLGVGVEKTEANLTNANTHAQFLKDSLDRLGKKLEQVTEDPSWKMPEPGVIPRRNPPPSPAVGMNPEVETPPAPPGGWKPVKDQKSLRGIGTVEIGVLASVVVGGILLAVLLKRAKQ